MGFESFRVELRGGPASAAEVDEAVRQLAHVRPDFHALRTPGSTCYLVDDGRHVIEVETLSDPPRASCRFTLCHPPSVDAAFLSLLRQLMRRLGMEVTVPGDEGERRPFRAEEDELSATLVQRIAARRAEWVAAFGNECLAATTPEAHERFVLPRCAPVASVTR